MGRRGASGGEKVPSVGRCRHPWVDAGSFPRCCPDSSSYYSLSPFPRYGCDAASGPASGYGPCLLGEGRYGPCSDSGCGPSSSGPGTRCGGASCCAYSSPWRAGRGSGSSSSGRGWGSWGHARHAAHGLTGRSRSVRATATGRPLSQTCLIKPNSLSHILYITPRHPRFER